VVNAYTTIRTIRQGEALLAVGCNVTAPGQTLATRAQPRDPWEAAPGWARRNCQVLPRRRETNPVRPHRVVVYVLYPDHGEVQPHAALGPGRQAFPTSWGQLLTAGVIEPAGGRRRRR
jgi:hypothetical protein